MNQYQNIYFIGIGGIGMSSLAQYFLEKGCRVAGYDRVASPITQMLQDKGIDIHFCDDLSLIPKPFLVCSSTLVVYTPAIHQHSELEYFRQHNFKVLKRSVVLGEITKDTFCFAVAGTHGKTTTTSILAHILVQAGAPVSAFLGGICENFGSNIVLNGDKYTVVEADEFDRSFLALFPDIACITSCDSDHLDIYGSQQKFFNAFVEFSGRLKKGGKLIYRWDLPFKGIGFSIDGKSDYSIRNICVKDGAYHFDILYFKGVVCVSEVKDCVLHKPGRHNLLNALAAVAMAHSAGFELETLGKALSSFKGVDRRFSYRINTPSLTLIDDYAHHPTELEALHQAVSEMYPKRHVTIMFQPHLYTRTRDFAKGFVEVLSKFNRVVLLDIYPAREEPIEGVTSSWICSMLSCKDKEVISKSDIPLWLDKNTPDVLLMVGAGDIGLEVDKVKTILQGRL